MKNLFKIVITGGPCSGKTTVINLLKEKNYKVIPEVATIIIKENLNKDDTEILTWKNFKKFQKEVIKRQLKYENMLNNEEGIVFLDRGIYDSIAYLKKEKIEDKSLFKVCKSDYDIIFILEPLPFLESNDIRRESEEERKLIHFLIYDTYKEYFDRIFIIHVYNPRKRVEEILKIVNDYVKKYTY